MGKDEERAHCEVVADKYLQEKHGDYSPDDVFSSVLAGVIAEQRAAARKEALEQAMEEAESFAAKSYMTAIGANDHDDSARGHAYHIAGHRIVARIRSLLEDE